MRSRARDGVRIAPEAAKRRPKNFFWIQPPNRCSAYPFAIGIARIARSGDSDASRPSDVTSPKMEQVSRREVRRTRSQSPARVAMGDARCASRICFEGRRGTGADDRRSRTMHAVRRPRSRSQSRWPKGQTRYPARSTAGDGRPRAARCWSKMRSVDSHCALISLILEQLCRVTLERPPVTRPPSAKSELGLDQIVDGLRVRLAAGRLHDLPDEPADCLRIGLGVADLVGIGGDDLIDQLLDRAQVRHLLHSARLNDCLRIAALGPDDVEQLLGDLAGDRALPDQIKDRAELGGRDRRAGDVLAFLVETAEQLVDHPVGGALGVAAPTVRLPDDRLEIVGDLPPGDEPARIVFEKPEILHETDRLALRP